VRSEVRGPTVIVDIERLRRDDAKLIALGVGHHQEAARPVALDPGPAQLLRTALVRRRVVRTQVEVHAVLRCLWAGGPLENHPETVAPIKAHVRAGASGDRSSEELTPERGDKVDVVAVDDDVLYTEGTVRHVRDGPLEPGVVFGFGDVGAPVRSALGDGDVGHEVLGGGAVPVLFAIGCIDHVAGAYLDGGSTARLHEAPTFGDAEGLPPVVGMPGGTRSGGEVHGADVEVRRFVAPGEGVDPDVAGEPFGRALQGRLSGL
jgi:hypothetical protein